MGMDRRASSEPSFSEPALPGLSHRSLHLTGDLGPLNTVQPGRNAQESSCSLSGPAGRPSAPSAADEDLDVASVFAHELAQPLTAIANYVQACRKTLAPCRGQIPDRAFECIEKALTESMRANQVIRKLRTLVDRQALERTKEDINQVVEQICADLSQMAFEHGVTLELDLDRSLPAILIDRIQTQLVIANLVRNGIDALRGAQKKRITVKTSCIPDGVVRVEVSDTGPGLSPRVADRLFRPIISHKPEGMGIGLSICHTIISAHGGRLSVRSTPGKGTDFHIIFPMGEAVDEQKDNPDRR